MVKVMKVQRVFYHLLWLFWQPIKRSRRRFTNIFDLWFPMDAFLYVEVVAMVSAHSVPLDIP